MDGQEEGELSVANQPEVFDQPAVRVMRMGSDELVDEVEAQETLAKAVVQRRNQLGMTQAELAAAGGISLATVQAVEAGRAGNLRRRTAAGLERALRWGPEGTVADGRWPGREIRERRLERGLTQAELADQIGVHRATIRAAEQDKPIEDKTWIGLRKALSVPVPVAAGDDIAPPQGRAELVGLGAMVAVMDQLDAGERRRVLAFLADRYGEVVPA